MLSWIVLIALGTIITGLMFYSFYIVLFSKHDYNKPTKADLEKIHSATDKLRSKFVGRA